MVEQRESPIPIASGHALVSDRQGANIGVNFGGHKAFFAASEADQHDLPRSELG